MYNFPDQERSKDKSNKVVQKSKRVLVKQIKKRQSKPMMQDPIDTPLTLDIEENVILMPEEWIETSNITEPTEMV